MAAAECADQSGPSVLPRLRTLGTVQRPASYTVWDLLAHPELGDVRSRPYTEWRALLLDLLHDVPLPVQGPEALPVDGFVYCDWSTGTSVTAGLIEGTTR